MLKLKIDIILQICYNNCIKKLGGMTMGILQLQQMVCTSRSRKRKERTKRKLINELAKNNRYHYFWTNGGRIHTNLPDLSELILPSGAIKLAENSFEVEVEYQKERMSIIIDIK
jgi:hypothetical protein